MALTRTHSVGVKEMINVGGGVQGNGGRCTGGAYADESRVRFTSDAMGNMTSLKREAGSTTASSATTQKATSWRSQTA